MYGMRKDELRLLPHDPAWEKDFLAEKARITHQLGDPSARIEHVGSTSIPTVHAKPILDIAILCGEKGLDPLIRVLEGLGYEYRGRFDDEAGRLPLSRSRQPPEHSEARRRHAGPTASPHWPPYRTG